MTKPIKFRAFIPGEKIMVDVDELDIKGQVFHYWHPTDGAAKNSIAKKTE